MPKKPKPYNQLITHKALLSLIAVLFFAAVANLVANINSTSLSDENGKPYDISESIETPDVPNKSFRSSTLGIEFSYPRQWTVSQGFDPQIGLGDKTNLRIKSPKGVVIHIEPSYLGPKENETCQHNIFDRPHNTLSCNTIEVFSKQKVALGAKNGDTYLVKAVHTGPRPSGSGQPPKSHYLMFLSSDPKLTMSTGPLVGNWQKIGSVTTDSTYLSSFISGVDDTDKNYFKIPEVIQAEQILKTFTDYMPSQ